MGELPPRVQERLDRLAQRFASDLPAKIAEVQALLDSSREGKEASLGELGKKVHEIAGAAATFGFDTLTIAAREAEKKIGSDRTNDGRMSVATESAVADFVAACSGFALGGDKSDEHNGDRVVFALVDSNNPLEGFEDQLSVFGYRLRSTSSLDEIGSCVRDGVQKGGCESTVIVADLGFFAEKFDRLKQLKKIRDEFGCRVHLILIAGNNDFETRLKTVRFGADAFFELPLEFTQLVDKLEDLLAQLDAEPYHVLIVDDDPEQVSETALVLQEAGMITSVVSDPEYLFQILVEYKPELILMDMYMPKCSGMELAKIIRQNNAFVGIPIVFLSVERDQKKQLQAIRCGGDDFLTKPIDPDHLVTSVRIRAARTRAMRFFMERDSLTGLLNHTNIKTRLHSEIDRARRIGTQLAFVMIDIDRFKSVNDTYGHLTGDRVLKSLARLLQDRLRRTDIIGRYGGEEFAIVLFNTDAEKALAVVNEIRENFGKIRQNTGSKEFSVTLSAGIAEYPAFLSPGELNEAADKALYEAKESGRNRVVIADS